MTLIKKGWLHLPYHGTLTWSKIYIYYIHTFARCFHSKELTLHYLHAYYFSIITSHVVFLQKSYLHVNTQMRRMFGWTAVSMPGCGSSLYTGIFFKRWRFITVINVFSRPMQKVMTNIAQLWGEFLLMIVKVICRAFYDQLMAVHPQLPHWFKTV